MNINEQYQAIVFTYDKEYFTPLKELRKEKLLKLKKRIKY